MPLSAVILPSNSSHFAGLSWNGQVRPSVWLQGQIVFFSFFPQRTFWIFPKSHGAYPKIVGFLIKVLMKVWLVKTSSQGAKCESWSWSNTTLELMDCDINLMSLVQTCECTLSVLYLAFISHFGLREITCLKACQYSWLPEIRDGRQLTNGDMNWNLIFLVDDHGS